jgi:hypothetical protein
VSSHSFDDIPTIYGAKQDAKSLEALRVEGIECYTPRAEVVMTPLLDYSSVLAENLSRRVTAMSEAPGEEGVVLVAYGSEPYEEEWNDTFSKLAEEVAERTGTGPVFFTWCGHIVKYDPDPTSQAIQTILDERQRALVIPALVARDEVFQEGVIREAVTRVGHPGRIVYRADSVLPDPNVNQWIIDTAIEFADGWEAP